ncbi:MAG: GNAT family N-acetyltransferase, partial [Myxococcota bacterium]
PSGIMATGELVEPAFEIATLVAARDGLDVDLARCAPDDRSRDTAWLISMWVAPEARGAGVGEALIDAVVDWARSTGTARLLLDVGDDNGPARALYTRKGFAARSEVSTLPPPRDHIREHQLALKLS